MSHNDDSMVEECAYNRETNIEARLQKFEDEVQWHIDLCRRLYVKRGRMEDGIALRHLEGMLTLFRIIVRGVSDE